MSILKLSAQGTWISAGLCTSAMAKRGQSKKQKSKTWRKPERIDQLKEATTVERGVVQDVTELTRTSSSSPVPATADRPDLNGVPEEISGLVVADRGDILKACIGTSGGLSLAGVLVRQVSHSAAESGWPVVDCTTLMPWRAEVWHVIPTVGAVVLVTSLRQIFLQLWPDFAQSSQRANNQVLRPLESADIFTVSCLSGMSEELLFRGALLPFLGPDWKGVLGTGFIFGALHLSGGRNVSFAVWASFVGVVYGILGLYTSDLATPMAAHSVANLLGAAIWKMSQNDEKSKHLN